MQTAYIFAIVQIYFFSSFRINIQNIGTRSNNEYSLIMIENTKIRLVVQSILHLIHYFLLFGLVVKNEKLLCIKEQKIIMILLTESELDASISEIKFEYLFKLKNAIFSSSIIESEAANLFLIFENEPAECNSNLLLCAWHCHV